MHLGRYCRSQAALRRSLGWRQGTQIPQTHGMSRSGLAQGSTQHGEGSREMWEAIRVVPVSSHTKCPLCGREALREFS